MALDPRIAELETHLESWNRKRRLRTGMATLVPIGVAAGLGWLAQDRIRGVEGEVDSVLDRLAITAPAGERDRAARLA
ncbi:MAG: hypothetical protein NZ555_06195, partial [Geminicoccaceae bacterium]|nr:hypothetical protein [Geminicoccaceae bacterium]